jgi:hypothetical protein
MRERSNVFMNQFKMYRLLPLYTIFTVISILAIYSSPYAIKPVSGGWIILRISKFVNQCYELEENKFPFPGSLIEQSDDQIHLHLLGGRKLGRLG